MRLRSPSNEVQALIEQAYSPSSFRGRFSARGAEVRKKALQRIAAADEPSAVPLLLPLVLSSSSDAACGAAITVHRLVTRMPVADLPELGELIRELPCHWIAPERRMWDALKPVDLWKLQRFGEANVTLLGAASQHRSGYVREAAVRALSEVRDGSELPFVLIRLNDWVPQVRLTAIEVLRERLIVGYAPHFVRSLPLILRAAGWTRVDLTPAIDAIFDILERPEARDTILGGLEHPEPLVRRTCFRLALTSPGVDRTELIRHALRQGDVYIRLWAARQSDFVLRREDLDGVLQQMRSDRYMPVRRKALELSVSSFPERAPQTLEESLFDPHPEVRRTARFYLGKQSESDFARRYREALTETEGIMLVGAIGGLGETGVPEDALCLLPFLKHVEIRVRRSAVRAVGNLGGDRHLEHLLEALADPAPGVSKEARRMLAARSNRVGGERLWKLFLEDPREHVQQNALALLAELSKWESVVFLIRAACAGIRNEAAGDYLRRWLARYNTSFLVPNPQQLGLVEQALNQCGAAFPSSLRVELLSILRSWRSR